jgi:hypothetical protein
MLIRLDAFHQSVEGLSMRSVKWIIIFSLFLMIEACQYSGAELIKPYATDGCSKFPDGTRAHRDLWLKCCTEHDKKYWAGGSYAERANADLELRACVQSVGEPAIAELMLAGVRVGGSPWWPSTFRWGYGWPYTHGYKVLTQDELEQIRKQKEALDLNLKAPGLN